MNLGRRSPGRRLIPLLALALGLLVPQVAGAAPTVHEIEVGEGSLSAASQAARVPARAPLPRFRSSAAASSLHVANSSEAGLRTNGKILAVDPREGPYSCSGTALNTPSRSIVLTAGHCAIENGVIGRRIVFVPAYDHGARPFGSFTVSAAYVIAQWRHGENPDYDVAALRVRPNRLGFLADVVGGRGYEVARPRNAIFQIYGYPAAALRGEELRTCRAHGLGSDPLTFRYLGPPTLPGSCDMAAGASGGAWIADGEYINGVTSYGYTGRPTRLYSPYFGDEVGEFLGQLP
jgi:hypothetical protein